MSSITWERRQPKKACRAWGSLRLATALMGKLEFKISGSALRFRVHVKPRAARTRVLGVRSGILDVAVTASPVQGQANAELQRTLSRHLQVPRSAVNIVSGRRGRTKLVSLAGLSASELLARLGG